MSADRKAAMECASWVSTHKFSVLEYRNLADAFIEVTAELAALRELHNIYNLGGMTDYNDGPMKRALAAEQRATDLQARLDRVEAELRGNVDRAYCDYIGQMKRDTCFGVEYKLKHGTFSQDNLDALMRAAELLGQHKAFHEAIRVLSAQS